jgi:hypothetical protein
MTRLVLHHGDCVEVLKGYADRSIGAIVSDPPYGLSFMGKDFDKLGEGAAQREWHLNWLREAFRVLRPGGVIKAFSGSRTFHHLAYAVEQVGFTEVGLEAWSYGSGFPKSLNIGKAIDKAAGAEREKVRVEASEIRNPKSIRSGHGVEGGDRPWMQEAVLRGYHEKDGDIPVTPEAQRWDGWGTALKPAWEPVVTGRKPL